ncbi:Imm50 family immunity protein [Streptomyces sp. NPDC000229]|uniref:Imm50 family immunity protein n=1 Tax=Streptomyces sp. NPDC000229 TaxID=3154247 RepID=UPI00331BAE4C
MGESDWTTVLNSKVMTDSYTSPPNLSECRLHYTQIDEREASVTLAFETSALPSSPPADWKRREYNTVEFYLKFTGVKKLRVAGWDFTIRDAEVTLSRCGDEGIQVSLAAVGSHIDFMAAQCIMPRMRSYLSAQE